MRTISATGSLMLAAIAISLATQLCLCRSIKSVNQDEDDEAAESAVIPAPTPADDALASYGDAQIDDIRKMTAGSESAPIAAKSQVAVAKPVAKPVVAAAASASASSIAKLYGAPVYASPLLHSTRSVSATQGNSNFEPQESSHAPLNYAPRPQASDLKTSASYGHHHHGGHHGGYDHKGWLDMGAWSGGKGSFGWYADFPVGGKHGYGHGYGR